MLPDWRAGQIEDASVSAVAHMDSQAAVQLSESSGIRQTLKQHHAKEKAGKAAAKAGKPEVARIASQHFVCALDHALQKGLGISLLDFMPRCFLGPIPDGWSRCQECYTNNISDWCGYHVRLQWLGARAAEGVHAGGFGVGCFSQWVRCRLLQPVGSGVEHVWARCRLLQPVAS